MGGGECFFGEEEGSDFGVVDANVVCADVGGEALGACEDGDGGFVLPVGVGEDGVVGGEGGLEEDDGAGGEGWVVVVAGVWLPSMAIM